MNLRQLLYFVNIADLRSFTRAATVLRIAQPALSRQILSLEEELGVKLFDRSEKGVRLTDAGAALRRRASALLEEVSRIRDEIGAHAQVPRGEINFGLPPSMFELVTVPLSREFLERFPGVLLRINEGISMTLHELVVAGRLDAAIISDVEPVGTLRSEPMLREQLYLVGARGADLPGDREVDLGTVATKPLVLTSRPNALRLIVEEALAAAGYEVKLVLETSSTRLSTELIAAGLGYSVLPYCAVESSLRAGRLSAAAITGLFVTWTLVSSRERSMPLAGQKLRDLFVEVTRRRIAEGAWRGAVALS